MILTLMKTASLLRGPLMAIGASVIATLMLISCAPQKTFPSEQYNVSVTCPEPLGPDLWGKIKMGPADTVTKSSSVSDGPEGVRAHFSNVLTGYAGAAR